MTDTSSSSPAIDPAYTGEEISYFIKSLYKGIKKFGLVRIERKLKELSLNSYELQQISLRDTILQEVSDSFGLAPRIITHSKKRGKITQAKVMAIVLFHAHLDMLQREIANVFDKKPSLISRRIAAFRRVNANAPPVFKNELTSEKIFANGGFMEKYKEINGKIIQYKKTQGQASKQTQAPANSSNNPN